MGGDDEVEANVTAYFSRARLSRRDHPHQPRRRLRDHQRHCFANTLLRILTLTLAYLVSFFWTSVALTWFYHYPAFSTQLKTVPFDTRPLGNYDERRKIPLTQPSDFTGLQLLRLGDPIYQYGPWDKAPIVIESHKLLFWTTPKVACTLFKKLFRRIYGYKDWQQVNSLVPHPPDTNGLNYLYHYTPAQADFILTDPSWTRAIFVRKPKERILSAYLDKVASHSLSHENNQHAYLHNHCCHIVSLQRFLHCPASLILPNGMDDDEQMTRDSSDSVLINMTFSDFLHNVVPACSDPHWKPQSHRMPVRFWPTINFVGRFEDLTNDTLRLWNKVGMPTWENDSKAPNLVQLLNQGVAHHATDAKKRISEYYSAELERFVVGDLYRDDYSHPIFLNVTKQRP